jgi:hypothetical protein
MVNEPQNVGVKEVERFRSSTWSGTTYGLIWLVQLDETGGVVTVSCISVGACITLQFAAAFASL